MKKAREAAAAAPADASGRAAKDPPPGERLTIAGEEVVATLPEGSEQRLPLAELVHRLHPGLPDSGGAILGDGVKLLRPIEGGLAVVHQTPPQVYAFRWIADDSEKDYGPGTRYRDVRLALPYVVVVAIFEHPPWGGNVPILGMRNQCFFSNHPLEERGLATPLAYPALLNCSRFEVERRGMLSWICTQHVDREALAQAETLEASLRQGLATLLRHLFESGFNRSSEHHEGGSGFGATVAAKVDPRLASVERWAEASRADPLFALEVPWLPAERTLGALLDEIEGVDEESPPRLGTAAEWCRLVFAAGRVQGGRSGGRPVEAQAGAQRSGRPRRGAKAAAWAAKALAARASRASEAARAKAARAKAARQRKRAAEAADPEAAKKPKKTASKETANTKTASTKTANTKAASKKTASEKAARKKAASRPAAKKRGATKKAAKAKASATRARGSAAMGEQA